jgi:hypothetical protein
MKSARSRIPAIVVTLIVLVCGAAAAGPTGSKVNPALLDLYAEHAAYVARSGSVPFAASNPLARVADGRVVVDAVADGDALALETALSSLGMQNIAVFGRVVSGELPISAVPALQAVPSLRFAQPSYAARRVGAVTSQGDQAMRADLARSSFSVTGSGVKVGVLSDSFNCLGGASADVSSGDLPTVQVVKEGLNCALDIDEGRAMLQIVHDVAPGAELAFATADGGQAAFANSILALKAAGARVIVDDIGYLGEPMFQDGIIAQAVDSVVAGGAAYFSAAGNDARQSYESAFRAGTVFAEGAFPSAPDAPPFAGGTAHNFAVSGPADHMQRLTIPTGRTLIVSLQWDSPFFSVSGGSGSPNDVDLYLLNADGTQVVAGATSDNRKGDAVEVLVFTNPGATADFNLMIVNFAGPLPGFIKYLQLGSASITIQEFNTNSSTVFGHPNAAGAESVGAAAWFQTPAFGVSPPLLEPFSSAGGIRILFDTDGNRLPAPLFRPKPGIVAPDRANTTFFGGDIDIPQDPDDFPNFVGTSAAAPHAAAVAALLLQKEPSFSPAALYSVLESSAIDMGAPGFDFDSGFGLIQADAALRFISSPPISLGLTLNRETVSAGGSVQVDVSVANPGAALAVDVYFVILPPPAFSSSVGCPSGDAVVFLTAGSSRAAILCAGSTPPQNFPPLSSNLLIPAGVLPVTLHNLFSFPWPNGLPPGPYTFAVFVTPHLAFADGNMGPNDISAFGLDTVQSSP